MIELWFEVPERRMGYKQEIDGSQYLSISVSQISVSQNHKSQSHSLSCTEIG